MMARARLFVLVVACLAQLGLVVRAIADYETTLAEGEPLRFALAPVDPVDPFRGRYVALRFELERVRLPVTPEMGAADWVYLVLGVGEDGLAEARQLRAGPPSDGPYLRLRLVYYDAVDGVAHLAFPFDRFYAEESKAPHIERLYGSRPDRERTYALVRVRGGQGVIEALVVDGERF